MTRNVLYEGATYAAWGYFVFYVNINFGFINILPRVAADLLFLTAIHRWKEARRDLILLRPLGLLLAAKDAVDWFLSWGGGSLDGLFPLLELVIGIAELYFHFQFLTDCAALAENFQETGGMLHHRLLRWRSVQTLLITALFLLFQSKDYLSEWAEPAVGILAIAGVAVGFELMFALFELRRLFRGQETEAI